MVKTKRDEKKPDLLKFKSGLSCEARKQMGAKLRGSSLDINEILVTEFFVSSKKEGFNVTPRLVYFTSSIRAGFVQFGTPWRSVLCR